MKPRKYLRLPLALFLSASLLASAACAQEPKPSAFAVERLDKVNAFIERGDEANALQVLETMWQSPLHDDQLRGARRILQILAPGNVPVESKKRSLALKAAERLLALPGLAVEDEAWARAQRARLLFNSGEGDAEAAAVAYEQILAWPGAPSHAIVRAVKNAYFPLARLNDRDRRLALANAALAHPNLSAADRAEMMLERAGAESGAERKKQALEEAFALPGAAPAVRAKIVLLLADSEDDCAKKRALLDEVVRGPALEWQRWNAIDEVGKSFVAQQEWDGLLKFVGQNIERTNLTYAERGTLLGLRVQALDARGEAAEARRVREQIARDESLGDIQRSKALVHLGNEDAAEHPEQARAWWQTALAMERAWFNEEEVQKKFIASYRDGELGQAKKWLQDNAGQKWMSANESCLWWALLGRRQEEAGQANDAVRSFARSLRGGSTAPADRNIAKEGLERLLPAAMAAKKWELAIEGHKALLGAAFFHSDKATSLLALSSIHRALGDEAARKQSLRAAEALDQDDLHASGRLMLAVALALQHSDNKETPAARARLAKTAGDLEHADDASADAWWSALRALDQSAGRTAAAKWIAGFLSQAGRDNARLWREYKKKFK